MLARSSAYRVDPGRRWSGCGSTGRTSARTRRPSSGCSRSTSATSTGSTSSGSPSWLPRRPSPTASTTAIRVNGRLVAAAGTHVISPTARLAVVGNVLTHVDYRGRGFATAVTGAVTAELLRYCDQVVLNVRADNPPALQAYRRSATPSTSGSRSASSIASARPGPSSPRRCAASSPARRPTPR